MTKEERREYNKKYYQANRERYKEYYKQYYQDNAELFKEYRKENAEYHKEYNKQYYQNNSERRKEQMKRWNKDNSERRKEYDKQYRKTPMGRASHLLMAYNQSDKKHNRGKGNLTAEWIVENIFSKPCTHCGISGWEVIGCNRIDNDKPHTKDNVEPCCGKCNINLPRKKTNEPSY